MLNVLSRVHNADMLILADGTMTQGISIGGESEHSTNIAYVVDRGWRRSRVYGNSLVSGSGPTVSGPGVCPILKKRAMRRDSAS